MPRPSTEERGMEQLAREVSGTPRPVLEVKGRTDQLERMWHTQWLLKFALGAVVVLALLGTVLYFVFRGAAEDPQLVAAAEEARLSIEKFLSEGNVADAKIACDAAAQRGVSGQALANLSQLVERALVDDATQKIDALITEKKPYAAIFSLQKANELGLPSAAYTILDQKIRDAMGRETAVEVKALCATRKYKDAESVLDKARQHGLPHDLSVDIEKVILQSARQHREELHARVRTAIEAQRPEDASRLLAEAEALDQYAGGDESRQTREELRAMMQDQARDEGKRLLAKSQDAAKQMHWDEAISLLEQAKTFPQEGPSLGEWERNLRDLVGGRLLVTCAQPRAIVRTSGREDAPAGEVMVGLPTGSLEVSVHAKGFIPQAVTTEVRFPEITSLPVDLKPSAYDPVWAIRMLESPEARYLAVSYYKRKSKNKPWAEAVSSIASEAKALVKTDKTEQPLVEGDFDAAMNRLHKAKGGPIKTIERLAEFIEKTHGASAKFFKSKKHLAALRRCLQQLEDGCPVCGADGIITCSKCKGRGKAVEMGTCLACGGLGHKVCPHCKGTGSVRCKRCNGSGEVVMKVKRPGQLLTEHVRETCPKCHGTGAEKCTKCVDGHVRCSICKGTKNSKCMRDCSACNGQGGHPCHVCDGSGLRERMRVAERSEVEQAAIDSHGPRAEHTRTAGSGAQEAP